MHNTRQVTSPLSCVVSLRLLPDIDFSCLQDVTQEVARSLVGPACDNRKIGVSEAGPNSSDWNLRHVGKTVSLDSTT